MNTANRFYTSQTARASLVSLCIYIGLLWPVLAGDSLKAMTFQDVSTGGAHCCWWIQADGEISPSTPADFQAFLVARGSPLRVGEPIVFNSPGGDIRAAIELGRMLRSSRAFTTVGGECLSACAFAFMGGERRSLYAPEMGATDGKIGVHRFDAVGGNPSVASAQIVAGVITGYLTDMGVDPRLVTFAAATPSDNMHILTNEEATRFKVITDDVPTAKWQLTKLGVGTAFKLSGAATNGYNTSFNYTMYLFCESQTRQEVIMQLYLDESGKWPYPIDAAGNILNNFCKDFSIELGDGLAANCSMPDTKKPVVMEVRRAGKYQERYFFIDIALNEKALNFIDHARSLDLAIMGTFGGTDGKLPAIDLPWDERDGMSTLLRKSCSH